MEESYLSKSPTDYLTFRQLRNKAIQAVRQAKSGYFKAQFTQYSSDPNVFWKSLGILAYLELQ